MSLKHYFEKATPKFGPGGKYHKFYPLFEAVETIFYTPGKVNQGMTHVRDSIDLKRIMIMVWLAVFPAMFWGMYNIGQQASDALLYGMDQASAQQALVSSWQLSWVWGSLDAVSQRGGEVKCGLVLLTFSRFMRRCLSLVVSGKFCCYCAKA